MPKVASVVASQDRLDREDELPTLQRRASAAFEIAAISHSPFPLVSLGSRCSGPEQTAEALDDGLGGCG